MQVDSPSECLLIPFAMPVFLSAYFLVFHEVAHKDQEVMPCVEGSKGQKDESLISQSRNSFSAKGK
jgi:hypothetical protein